VFFWIHFALGLGGFLALSGWALGSADGGIEVPAAVAGWVERIVHFGLLQPLAHWVLSAGIVAWWTWPGLIALIALIAVNSVAAVALAALVVLGRRRWFSAA
jgi:hypothetical protein